MTKKLGYFLLLVLMGCGTDSIEKSEVSIIGGTTVPNDPPSTTGLVTPTGGCTGVRIADNTYMTATHCFGKTTGTEA